MSSHFDCIVIGLGGFGSAAAYAAARRGLKVLGLEQFGPAHDRGSSHGESRIIRRAYFEHPDYVPLADRSYALWESLGNVVGRELYRRTGLILVGPPQGEAVAGTLRAAREHGLEIEELSTDEARRRFPAFRFEEGDAVVYESDAGWLPVEACVAAHLDAARTAGADLHFGATVRDVRSEGAQVRVITDRETFTAAFAVVAAGAWSAGVLAELALPLAVRRKVQLWFPVRGDGVAAQASSPGFLFERPAGVFYGFPCIDGETVKVAEHSGGDAVADPAAVDRELHDVDVAPVARFVGRALPLLDPQPRRHSVCMYTMSPDGHFIVDRHPALPNVAIAAGFSGHGFKFTPVIGEAVIDLATEGRTEIPIGFLQLTRFTQFAME
jgi:sarcosine oxidase